MVFCGLCWPEITSLHLYLFSFNLNKWFSHRSRFMYHDFVVSVWCWFVRRFGATFLCGVLLVHVDRSTFINFTHSINRKKKSWEILEYCDEINQGFIQNLLHQLILPLSRVRKSTGTTIHMPAITHLITDSAGKEEQPWKVNMEFAARKDCFSRSFCSWHNTNCKTCGCQMIQD